MGNKWEYKEVFSKGYMEDEYSGHYEVTNGDIVLRTVDDPEDVTESENTLQRVAKALNESGCKFYCHTTAEHALHIENMELRETKLQADNLRIAYDALGLKYQDLKAKYAHLETKYDNILATESGHESKTENVWQSGYASGHEVGCEKTLKAQQGGFVRETIEDILFKSGKLYQEECTYLADIILQDCSGHYQELKEDVSGLEAVTQEARMLVKTLKQVEYHLLLVKNKANGGHEINYKGMVEHLTSVVSKALNEWNGNGQKKEGEDGKE